MSRTIHSIIEAARIQMRMLESDLKQLKSPTASIQEKQKAFVNMASIGRSVTINLQGLKTPAGELRFTEWYAPFLKTMVASSLMKTFVDARNDWEKRGEIKTTGEVGPGSFNTAELISKLPPAPECATGFFIGDKYGGSGWEVQLPDGTTEKYYVNIADIDPTFNVSATMHGANLRHEDQEIQDTSIANCSTIYVEFLKRMVSSAEKFFL